MRSTVARLNRARDILTAKQAIGHMATVGYDSGPVLFRGQHVCGVLFFFLRRHGEM